MTYNASRSRKLLSIIAAFALIAGLAVGGYVVYDAFFAQQEEPQSEIETEPEETREVIVDPENTADTNLNEINDFADENRPDQETEFVPDPDNAGIAN